LPLFERDWQSLKLALRQNSLPKVQVATSGLPTGFFTWQVKRQAVSACQIGSCSRLYLTTRHGYLTIIFRESSAKAAPSASHEALAVLALIFQDATRIFRRAVLRPSFSPGIAVLAAGIAIISLPQSHLCGEVASLFGKAQFFVPIVPQRPRTLGPNS